MGPLANGRKHWQGVQMVTVQEWLRARKARLQNVGQKRERARQRGSRSAEGQSQEVQDPAATEEADGSGVSEAGQETEPQD